MGTKKKTVMVRTTTTIAVVDEEGVTERMGPESVISREYTVDSASESPELTTIRIQTYVGAESVAREATVNLGEWRR